MEKKIVKISPTDSERLDFEFWISKTPEEKLDALQQLRDLVHDLKNESGNRRFSSYIRRATPEISGF
jgi:hypothetical protein